MAGNSNRDVTLTLNLETLGQADVAKLQASLKELAAAGGDAAPEFQRLADEVSKLGTQTEAITTFKTLSEQVETLAAKQQATSATSAEMLQRLEALRSATADLQAQERAATEALTAGQLAYVNATNALRTLKAEYDNAGKQTAEYRSQLLTLTSAQNDARAALVGLRADQRESTQETNASEAALSKLETAYGRQTTAATRAANALATGQTALQESVVAANALGIATDDIATAEGNLVAAYNAGVTAIHNYTAAQQAAAAATAETNWQAEAESIVNAAEATQRLARETEIAAAAAKEMASLASFEKAAADAQRLVAAAEYVDFWTQALKRADAEAAAENWQKQAEDIVNAAHAAQELAAAAETLSAAEQELAAQNAFEKAAADAAQLRAAAEYVQFFETALSQLDAELARTAQEAALTSERINNAFKTLGGGSVQQLELQIAEVRAAMLTLEATGAATGSALSTAFSSGNAKIAELEAQIRKLTGTMTLADEAAAMFKDSMIGQVAAGNLLAQGVGFVIQKIKDLGAAFVEAISEQQKFNNALNAIYKDAAVTASQLDFLRQVALSSGQSVGELQGAFIKFSASMKVAGIGLQQSNDLFSALARAAGTLGLSSEDTAGALEALSQMAAKGTVSMEELRQQLGDRLPGALGLVSQGLGISEAQLIKLVESGQLAARDLFPALTTALKGMQGEVDGLAPAFNNLKTALTTTAQTSGDAGWTQLLTNGLKGLYQVVTAVALIFAGFSEVIFGVAKAAGVLVGALFTLSNPMDELKQIVTDAAARQAKLTATLEGTAGATATVTGAMTSQIAAVSNLSVATDGLGTVLATSKTAQDSLTAAHKVLATATGQTGQSFVGFLADLQQSITTHEKAAEAADKLAKATAAEGAAMVTLTQLRGNDQASLDASVVAMNNNVAALEKAAEAHSIVTEQLQIERAAQIQKTGGNAAELQSIAPIIAALDQKIAKSLAETEQSKAAVAQVQAELAVRQVQAQTYRDNSDSIDLFRRAMEAADITLSRMQAGEAVGIVTKEQLAEATLAAAKAHALYNDALADAAAKIKSVAALEAAKNDVTIAGLQAKQQAAAAEAKHSAALGFTTASIIDQISAVRAQIAVVQAQAQAKAAAAQSEIDAANALETELRSTGNLTDAKLREIEATKAEAQVKLIAAGASKSVVQGLNDEITALYKKLAADQAASNATSNSTNTTNSDTSSRQANTSAIDAQTLALQKQKDAVSSTGLTKANGSSNGSFNNALPLDQIYSILAKRDNGTLGTSDLDAAKAALVQAQNAQQFLQAMAAQNAGSVSGGALQTTGAQLTALQQLVQSLTQQKQSEDLAAAKGPSTTTPAKGSSANSATSSGSTSHTVTVNLGGNTTTIGTATASDANALTALIQQLEAAANTATTIKP